MSTARKSGKGKGGGAARPQQSATQLVGAIASSLQATERRTAPAARTQFERICNDVLLRLQSFDEAAEAVQVLKDQLAHEDLPPVFLLRLLSTCGQLQRASHNFHSPLYELIRLVRLYAEPWDNKTRALQDLHQSYDQHHAQLKIALHRLEMTGAELEHSRRQHLIQLWERLFAKGMSRFRHGRRWKFLLQSFRMAAERGVTFTFDSDADDSDDDDDDGPPIKAGRRGVSECYRPAYDNGNNRE